MKKNNKKIVGVDVIIRNKKGKFLFQKKTIDAPHSGGLECLFGGGVDKGEEQLETLKRELIEELEFESSNNDNFFFVNYIEYIENRGNLSAIYFIDNVDDSEFVLHEGEKIVYYDSYDDILNNNELRNRLRKFFVENREKIESRYK